MQETQSEASLDREPLADSVRHCEFPHCGFLLPSGLDDKCLHSNMVAAGVLNWDLPICSCNEFILYMKAFYGSSRSIWLCDFILCSPELLLLCPRCKDGLGKARQGAQNETKAPEWAERFMELSIHFRICWNSQNQYRAVRKNVFTSSQMSKHLLYSG